MIMNLLNLKEKLLIHLAQNNAFVKSLRVSTPELARQLGTSQQSASRLLIQLERQGYLERRIVGKTGYVRLTGKGVEELRNLYLALKSIFERPVEIRIEGRVFTGMGEGSYYLGIDRYLKQIEERVGFKPYPGTLNLRLYSRDSIVNRMLLEKLANIRIDGFSNGKRTYGGARCIKALFNDEQEAAIIFIDRTHYEKDVVEVIAPIYLRGKYGLKDGDKVFLKVSLESAPFYKNAVAELESERQANSIKRALFPHTSQPLKPSLSR